MQTRFYKKNLARFPDNFNINITFEKLSTDLIHFSISKMRKLKLVILYDFKEKHDTKM